MLFELVRSGYIINEKEKKNLQKYGFNLIEGLEGLCHTNSRPTIELDEFYQIEQLINDLGPLRFEEDLTIHIGAH